MRENCTPSLSGRTEASARAVERASSDPTATKPPNKAGRPATEAVERRAEAKENANRCHTCRTQCRESVSLAPERVRKAEASRQTSEVGAVCRKAARTVLCGGRPVMGVPTAIDAPPTARAPSFGGESAPRSAETALLDLPRPTTARMIPPRRQSIGPKLRRSLDTATCLVRN